jgi:hypothetical protein
MIDVNRKYELYRIYGRLLADLTLIGASSYLGTFCVKPQ